MLKPARVETCPRCRRPSDRATAPFCSKACRDRDLLAWLDESHRIPGRPLAADDDDS